MLDKGELLVLKYLSGCNHRKIKVGPLTLAQLVRRGLIYHFSGAKAYGLTGEGRNAIRNP